MTRRIITHVGTSMLICLALKECTYLTDAQEDWQKWLNRPAAQRGDEPVADGSNTRQCADYLTENLKQLWTKTYEGSTGDDPKLRRDASPAEIASLSLLTVEANDQVVLLHSDTAEGYFCAWLLQEVLGQNIAPAQGYPCYPRIRIRRVSVAGLCISSDTAADDDLETPAGKDTFVREGLVNYVQEIWDECSQCQKGDELIFNITGGYKGMIPIARDLVLLLAAHKRDTLKAPIHSEVCYLYQKSSELIRYGALPVRFDWEAVSGYLLEKTHAGTTGMRDSPQEYEKPFFVNNGEAPLRLSALGHVVWALYQKLFSGEVDVAGHPYH